MVSRAASFWLPKTKHWLLFLIFILASTQLGLHLWPASALVYGVRVDYLSPTLYFLDILIIIYLLLNRPSLPNFYHQSLLMPLLLTNLLYSQNPPSTLNWSLHLLLYLVFLFQVPKKIFSPLVLFTLPLGALFQVTLGVVQVAFGHSLQGPLYYLGERLISVGQPSVALATFLDQIILRAYGTFGHPNVLAGWLVVSLLIILKISKNPIIKNLMLVGTTLGVFLTQSRSAGLALFGVILPFYFLINLRSKLVYLVICFTVLLTSPALFLLDRAELSLSERRSLQSLSLQIINRYPIMGTGANASISSYPALSPNFRLLQPDHNTLTLFLSWFGFIGLFSLIYLLRPQLITYSLFLIPLAPMLILDHYFLTSPQGLFILILYLKVVHYSHAQSNRQ